MKFSLGMENELAFRATSICIPEEYGAIDVLKGVFALLFFLKKATLRHTSPDP